MPNAPFDIVGFDLDGTLVDTSPDLAAAVNVALAHAGRPPLPVSEVRPMVGGGSRLMLRRGLAASGPVDEAEVERLLPILLGYYHDNIAVESRPFPGALAALDALADAGAKLAIVTNKLEGLALRLLDELALTRRFATVIGGDTLGPGLCKPEPDPIFEMVERLGGGRATFVGDSIYDVAAARAAGLPSVAVSFGFLDRPVQALGADHVIDHYDELAGALAALASAPAA